MKLPPQDNDDGNDEEIGRTAETGDQTQKDEPEEGQTGFREKEPFSIASVPKNEAVGFVSTSMVNTHLYIAES